MKNKDKLSITAIDRERDTDREKLKISLADTQEKQVGRQANGELERKERDKTLERNHQDIKNEKCNGKYT